MSRLAGRLILSLLASAGMAFSAHAADAPRRVVVHEDCGRGGEVVTTHYKEQVCYVGANGRDYAACRWIKRTHEVRIGAECPRPVTGEDAYPARRGAFGAALSVKG
jgi:hypothetical protein